MRIAQVAPLYESVPPTGYGGTERVIGALCDDLVAHGHDVTLFAAGSSATSARLVPVVPAPLRVNMSRREMIEVAPHLHLHMLTEVFARTDEFDVIHSHADLWTLPFVGSSSVPVVVTVHGRLDIESVRATLPLYPDVPLVSVSDSQRAPVDDLGVRWAATVHNGLDLRHYGATSHERGQHLVFAGRIHREKGPEIAVEVARRTGRTLQVGAKVDPLDTAYYERVVEPLFRTHGVRFVGEIDEHSKPAFFGSAAATLFPSDWPEPFGLVMIESMAAGTPVIALRRGAVPEVIVHGETGFICDGVDEMVDAVARLGEIDPDGCRRRAATFSASAMARRYEAVYRTLLDVPSPARRGEAALSGSIG